MNRPKSENSLVSRYFSREVLIFVFMLLILVTVFALAPVPPGTGDDWETFKGAAERILQGEPLYGEKVTHGYFSNPPWVALLFLPTSLLPFQWGWAVLCVVSLALIVVLSRTWKFGPGKTALILLSPATFYLLLHGEIDVLVLSGMLLPRETWYFVALTKPQVAIGLVLGVGREKIIKASLVLIVALIATVPFFGFWPLDVLRQPTPFVGAAHNLWGGIWPFQIPAGIAMLLLGVRRKDERFFISASPFLSPYAATSSLLGPWMVLASFLKGWEATLVLVIWWGTVIYRMLGF